MFTPEQITAIGGVMVGLIGAMGALSVALRTSRTAQRVEAKTDMAAARQEEIGTKVDEVHQLTNSRLQRIEDQLALTQAALREALHTADAAESARAQLAYEAAETLKNLARGNPPTVPPGQGPVRE